MISTPFYSENAFLFPSFMNESPTFIHGYFIHGYLEILGQTFENVLHLVFQVSARPAWFSFFSRWLVFSICKRFAFCIISPLPLEFRNLNLSPSICRFEFFFGLGKSFASVINFSIASPDATAFAHSGVPTLWIVDLFTPFISVIPSFCFEGVDLLRHQLAFPKCLFCCLYGAVEFLPH